MRLCVFKFTSSTSTTTTISLFGRRSRSRSRRPRPEPGAGVGDNLPAARRRAPPLHVLQAAGEAPKVSAAEAGRETRRGAESDEESDGCNEAQDTARAYGYATHIKPQGFTSRPPLLTTNNYFCIATQSGTRRRRNLGRTDAREEEQLFIRRRCDCRRPRIGSSYMYIHDWAISEIEDPLAFGELRFRSKTMAGPLEDKQLCESFR